MSTYPDVVIVDAGASGAVARLAAAGFDVVSLEESDWTDPGGLHERPTGDGTGLDRTLQPDPNTRRGPADYPLTGGV